jgi:hypothetical protein
MQRSGAPTLFCPTRHSRGLATSLDSLIRAVGQRTGRLARLPGRERTKLASAARRHCRGRLHIAPRQARLRIEHDTSSASGYSKSATRRIQRCRGCQLHRRRWAAPAYPPTACAAPEGASMVSDLAEMFDRQYAFMRSRGKLDQARRCARLLLGRRGNVHLDVVRDVDGRPRPERRRRRVEP